MLAYPDGDKTWSVGGGCCGPPTRVKIDDTAFVEAVVRQIEGQLSVDRRRIYASGISLGGLMDYRLVCDTSIFAAIGPDAATLLGPCPSPPGQHCSARCRQRPRSQSTQGVDATPFIWAFFAAHPAAS